MPGLLRSGAFLIVMASVAPAAWAQLETHCLPADMPAMFLPNSVLVAPTFESQELSVPLVRAAPKAPPVAADPGGRPDATSLDDMCKDPREVIRLVESKRFKEAALAGEPLLNQAREKFRDYTWDYLGTAVAWAFIQTGDPKGAAQAHILAAARIDDQAVADYHRVAARVLAQTKKTADELKDYAKYREELRAGLAERLGMFRAGAVAAKKARGPDQQLNYLQESYKRLRSMVAADAEYAREQAVGTFREAADGLVSGGIPAELNELKDMARQVHQTAAAGVPATQYDDWNRAAESLWFKVMAVKRLCRIHDYISRMGLAGGGGETRRFFNEAHACLFVPDRANLVWQEVAHIKMQNNVEQIDIRLRVPWQETPISPMGVPPSAQAANLPGWKAVNGRMNAMNGQMKPMTGKMTPPGKR